MGKLDGRCMCGSVSYECDAEPVMTVICHCRDCQRSSGSIGAVMVAVSKEQLVYSGDSLTLFETVGEDTGLIRQRYFCSTCGSPVFSHVAEFPELMMIRAGSLDDLSQLAPALEVWCDSAQPWMMADSHERIRLPRGP